MGWRTVRRTIFTEVLHVVFEELVERLVLISLKTAVVALKQTHHA